MSIHGRRALLFVVALGFLSPRAVAVSYSVTFLDPPGFDASAAEGISGNTHVGYGQGPSTGGITHALLWNGSAASFVDLTPPGYRYADARAVSGNTQVGGGEIDSPPSNPFHALLWRGTAASVVDLNPAGYESSDAFAISGNNQVGWGFSAALGGLPHAILWHGTAASAVDLHPAAGFDFTSAWGVSGNTQVGSGSGPITGGFSNSHALMWTGTADSYVDLHPAGFATSSAIAAFGSTQVGHAYTDPNPFPSALTNHAMHWQGTAASAVDLNPAGYANSSAVAISAAGQVGYGRNSSVNADHALLWNGTAASVLDLHQFLPDLPAKFVTSYARGIDDNGTIVGYATDTNNVSHAVVWSLVPEPAAMLLLLVGIYIASTCARRRSV